MEMKNRKKRMGGKRGKRKEIGIFAEQEGQIYPLHSLSLCTPIPPVPSQPMSSYWNKRSVLFFEVSSRRKRPFEIGNSVFQMS